ncbi:MAG: transcription termination/antitermination NusG family protein [Candidatus Thiodiazotropha sp.]|jgi:transcriptional antiterminator RfaH
MSGAQGWLVVMTKPKMEIEAKEHLARQGFEVYLPLWVDLRRRPGGWKKVKSAMFPRYLFTRPGYGEQSVSPIRSTRGVSHFVRFGVELAWVNDGLIEEIRVLEAARNDSGDELKPFKNGDQVLVMEGPFKGVTAEVLSSDQQRVILLLQVLGKTQQLEFEAGLCKLR